MSKWNSLVLYSKTPDTKKATVPRKSNEPHPSAKHPRLQPPGGILTSLSGRVSACWLGWRDGGLLTRSLGNFFTRRHFVTLGACPSGSPFWRHRCFFGLKFGFRLRKSCRTWNRSCRCFRVVFSVLYKWESEQKQTDTDTHRINRKSKTYGDSDTNMWLLGPSEPAWCFVPGRARSGQRRSKVHGLKAKPGCTVWVHESFLRSNRVAQVTLMELCWGRVSMSTVRDWHQPWNQQLLGKDLGRRAKFKFNKTEGCWE